MRCHNDRTWLRQSLYARRNVGCIAINFTGRIDHDRSGFNPDAGVKRWLANLGILAVHRGKRPLNRESSPRRAFSIVLLRYRIAEQHH